MEKGGNTKNTSYCQLPHNGNSLERQTPHVPSTHPNFDIRVVIALALFFFAQWSFGSVAAPGMRGRRNGPAEYLPAKAPWSAKRPEPE